MSRKKEMFRKAAYKIDYFLLNCFGKIIIQSKRIRNVHFSIDDVFEMAKDERSVIIDDLQRLYTEWGVTTHLYLFYKHEGKVLNQLPPSFKSLKCVDFGAHQAEYIDETYEKIGTSQISEYVRLHEFKATSEQLKKLKKYGVGGGTYSRCKGTIQLWVM